jgi:hypothetical protein
MRKLVCICNVLAIVGWASVFLLAHRFALGSAWANDKAVCPPYSAAKQHETHVKAYYRHLIDDNGLKKMQAVCAVMRKLLHAIHEMFKTRQTFDGSKFYALADAAAA